MIISYSTASYSVVKKKRREKWISGYLGRKLFNFKSRSKLLIYVLLYLIDLRKMNQLLTMNSDILLVLRF